MDDEVKPVTPKEALAQKTVPAGVIMAVNELIVQGYAGRSSFIIKLAPIKQRACELMGVHPNEFNTKWLDFEPLFARHGWKVEYDGPSYGDTYEPYFRFTPIKE